LTTNTWKVLARLCSHLIIFVIILFQVLWHFKNKAAGIDGIHAEFYKYASEKLVSPFCAVFDYIFDKGDYPIKWSEGLINALHKKGETTDPDNYRKITITAVMAKIFDSVLNVRLYFENV